jgi:hypothetical protein
MRNGAFSNVSLLGPTSMTIENPELLRSSSLVRLLGHAARTEPRIEHQHDTQYDGSSVSIGYADPAIPLRHPKTAGRVEGFWNSF